MSTYTSKVINEGYILIEDRYSNDHDHLDTFILGPNNETVYRSLKQLFRHWGHKEVGVKVPGYKDRYYSIYNVCKVDLTYVPMTQEEIDNCD